MKTINMVPAYETTAAGFSLHNDEAAMKQHTLAMQNMADVISYSEECICRAQRDLCTLIEDINRITSLIEGISSLHDELERIPGSYAQNREEPMVFVQESWIAETALHLKNLTDRLVG